MNLLLVFESELSPERLVLLRDRRAMHCLRVLGVSPGDTVRAGIVNRGLCTAHVVTRSAQSVTLRLSEVDALSRPRSSVALAVPRPKVLSRTVSACSSFGLDQLTLVNAWKVEKSYFSSPRLANERLTEDLLLGMEQGVQCHLPTLAIHRLFGEFLAAEERDLTGTIRAVLHPGAKLGLSDLGIDSTKAVRLVLGPEGGFLEREVHGLEELGYTSVDLGTGPLRTETAVAAALGQLALLTRQSAAR